ncbi:MAG TPA: FHA domain-containing protein [Arthrobacter sp.]|nr:FHA domain-containing protein [Arthrobacter sp.]
MAANNYVPGSWHGIVRSRTAILVGPDTPPQLVHSLWEMLENGPEVHELLHAVTSSFGVSLAHIPPFGIVDFKDSLRVFLRGDIDLTVQLPGGPLELHGRDVTTWAERHLAAPEWYRISVPGGEPAGPALPIQEGVVLLQALSVGPDGTAAAAAATPLAVHAVAVPAAAVPAVVAADPVPAVDEEPLPETEADATPLEADAAPSTDSPEHGASAETVIGVMDDEYDDLPGAEEGTGPAEDAVTPAEPAVLPAVEEPPSDLAVSAIEQMPASEQTSTYDHLWERTVVRSIEDAAVRDDPEGLLADAAAGKPAPADPAGLPPLASAPEMPAPGKTPQGGAPASARATSHAPAPTPSGGLIDSVPWRTAAGTSSQPAPASEDSGPEDTDHQDSDHDGQTIMKSDLASLAAPPAPSAAGTGAAGTAGPMVLARVCGQGHANPPTHAQCAACGQPLPADAVRVSRPRLGRMRVSSGELVDLDQSLVIGRQPSVSRVQGGGMPRLVQVASPGGDISRSHVEVRLEGWHVMLCDLKATNGTVLVREGQPPRRLAQNEMAILLDGDIADLGDGISLRFEEIL